MFQCLTQIVRKARRKPQTSRFMMKAESLFAAFAGALCVSAHPGWPSSPASTYAKCQKTRKHHPLDGCPRNTLYVSQDDHRADFDSIQDAISSLPNNTREYHILIAPGSYNEKLNVTREGPLTLLGTSDRPSKRQLYANIDYETPHENEVTIWRDAASSDGEDGTIYRDNVFGGVLTVGPNLDATLTGSGPTGWPVPEDTPFGNKDFRAYNIDFRNIAFGRGPAHAVGVSRANAGFYSCGLYSHQDTLYVGKLGNAYFYDTVIAGQTDFLYGFGTTWVEKSTLSLRSCGGGIIAWKGTNTTFENKYGAYVSHSRVLAANSTVAPLIKGQCSLGRPWNSLHRSVFRETYLDGSALPAGYTTWGGSTPNFDEHTFMATYEDFGPGYNKEAEMASNVTIVLNKRDARGYDSPRDVFQTESGRFGNVGWIDKGVYPRY